MRLLVFGAHGLLGATIIGLASRHNHVAYAAALERDIKGLLEKYSPDVVINCAGTDVNFLDMIYLNALFPHLLASQVKVPIYHMSTARVFQGHSQFKYTIDDTANALDMFGKTKSLGEVNAPHVTNVRSAFIGRGKGFVTDVLDRTDTFKGLVNYRWTGSTVEAVSHGVLNLIDRNWPCRIVHMATNKSISLYEAGCIVASHYDIAPERLNKLEVPVRNFALFPTYVIPALEEAIKDWARKDEAVHIPAL